MTDTLDIAVDAETARVEAALDEFIAATDPAVLSAHEYRGARYDLGLAWVHFPEGCGGLGVRPKLQRWSRSACGRPVVRRLRRPTSSA